MKGRSCPVDQFHKDIDNFCSADLKQKTQKMTKIVQIWLLKGNFAALPSQKYLKIAHLNDLALLIVSHTIRMRYLLQISSNTLKQFTK